MNIIISSLSEIKKTGVSQDLDSAKLFISKTLSNSEKDRLLSEIKLEGNGTYFLTAISTPTLDKNDYFGYFLTSDTFIPNGTYTFIIGELKIDSFEVLSNEELIDQHNPIYIIDRKINPITTTIVAQDVNSQQLTFYINKKYDGISFIDNSKTIYADYIPLNLQDLIAKGVIPSETTFLSDKVNIVSDDVQTPDKQNREWIMLQWNLPPLATQLSGSVKFAISVVDSSGDNTAYVWQTLPSAFTVSANLAKRSEIIISSPEDQPVLSELANQVNALQQDVDNLEVFLGNQSDDISDNDQEIIISGGGAPIND